jgi:hypothetical protein
MMLSPTLAPVDIKTTDETISQEEFYNEIPFFIGDAMNDNSLKIHALF